MKKDSRLLMLGMLLLSAAGCRKDPPPTMSIICLGDGFGGADCVLADGTRKSLLPSELKNYWMTTNDDMKNFSQWCYKATDTQVESQMQKIEVAIKPDQKGTPEHTEQ